ncbi:TPA: hypothetical protein HGR45_22775 [Escherichia coli]|nr:hypothetical protein [Escherichia coli]
MRENPGLAATVPVAPPLSRRGLRSRHPGKRPPGCKGQRRFAHALSVVAAGPGCLAASGRQARLRQAAAGAPASLRRTRWRGFGLSLRSDA